MNNYLYNPRILPDYDIIVFCHLRWDFVYQRPQHIISRLAETFKILVVEEPVEVYSKDKSYITIFKIHENIHICKPLVKDLGDLGSYLKKHLRTTNHPVGWFYSPAFVSVLESVDFDIVVYDCMDELSLFKGASPHLINQEKTLLAAADIVYAGGKSLYDAKATNHHNVFCFPSSVDVGHFSNATAEKFKPFDLQRIGEPIIGYYGVIDERIDLDLIRKTAARKPEFAFVMIGPLCKIETSDLPQADNIYYLGMKTYDELPRYLHFFDFAMMPFALNEATRYISPTKTLEYMAANKPIISTKIKDVVRDFSSCINLVSDEADFCNAIDNPVSGFENAYREILEKTSWDNTVEKMSHIINKVLA